MKRSWKPVVRLMAVSVLFVWQATIACGQDATYRFRPGLHLSKEHPPAARELKLLLTDLRLITGFSDIQINAYRDFVLRDRMLISGGSEIARALFVIAGDGADSFTVEALNHSPAIAFGQIESLLVYYDSLDRRHQDWHIRIDFADFKELHGDRAVIASFGPGMNFLHELTHAVRGYSDPQSSAHQLGQCETHINLIRAELGLPLRQNYFPRHRLVTRPESIAKVFEGEIAFVRPGDPSPLPLTFNVERVIDASAARARKLMYSDVARLYRK